MTNDEDKITRRIGRICSAKPATISQQTAQRSSSISERDARKSVFRLASIYIEKNICIRCIVNDVSDTGACLTLKTSQALPETVIVKFDHSGIRKRVRVVWQEEKVTGVAFSDSVHGIDEICAPGAPVKVAR